MAYFYTYIDPAKIEAQFKNPDDDDEEDYKFQMAKLEMVKHEDQVIGAFDQTKLWASRIQLIINVNNLFSVWCEQFYKINCNTLYN